MSDSWDDYAEIWDTDSDAILYSKKAFKSLIKIVNPQDFNVLDFGCGTGLLTEQISPLADNIIAVDSSDKMISILNNKSLHNVTTINDTLTEHSINSNPALQNEFDLIVASSVFSFIDNFESTLLLLKSLLASGGILIQWDWLASAGDSDHGLSINRIESAYSKTDLKLSSVTTPFSIDSSSRTKSVLMAVSIKP